MDLGLGSGESSQEAGWGGLWVGGARENLSEDKRLSL